MIRRFLSATVAPGGVGKSSLALVDALAMVTGRNLVNNAPAGRLKVWYWNLEDPQEEIDRRIAAACLHHGIGLDDLGDRLFVNSGRDTPLVIATSGPEGLKATPVLESLQREIEAYGIDALIVDPFIASHGVGENDNTLVNAVQGLWARLADATGCAVELVHHVRKAAPGQGEYTVDDGRGAGAFLAAVRSARVLNGMSKEEAERFGVEERRSYFRVDNGKANLAPPSDAADWHKLVSVDLGNDATGFGDSIGVVTFWSPPNPLAGITVADLRAAQSAVRGGGPWRADVQAKAWVGRPICAALNLDSDNKADRAKVSSLLKVWTEKGMFVVVEGKDDKSNPRKFVEVGEPAND
jgi:hypothetical protein